MRIMTLAIASTFAALSTVVLASAVHAATYTIMMKFDADSGDLFFEPAKLKVEPGDTVVWIQGDGDNEHNVAVYPDRIPQATEPFESPMLTKEGETWTRTFDQAGSYFYHCHPHEGAGMRGLVVVGRESLPEEFRQSSSGEMAHDHGDGDGAGHGGEHGESAMEGRHDDKDKKKMKDMKNDDHSGGGRSHGDEGHHDH